MSPHITKKRILLGITGSISCYKAFDLCRYLVNQGHQVKVVLTRGASKFLKEALFKHLGAIEVYTSDDDFKDREFSVLHVELARWTQVLLAYPLSANTLSKIAHGAADDLLSSVILTMDDQVKKLAFPSMNSRMLDNPITQENLDKISKMINFQIVPSISGVLACGELGKGKLPLPLQVGQFIDSLCTSDDNTKKEILISTGATQSPLDPVRFLSNPSSGITGHYLAQAFLSHGHRVTVIAGKNSVDQLDDLQYNKDFSLKRVITTNDMFKSIQQFFPSSDLYISAAAINDIEFEIAPKKIDKEQFVNHLPVKKATDVLAEVIKSKKPHQRIIGFAAHETLDPQRLNDKFKRKPVDVLVANLVHVAKIDSESVGFNAEKGTYLFNSEGRWTQHPVEMSKQELASYLLQWFSNKVSNQGTNA
jgi:phosphopantothenoylcysteine decarboxylase/phosphopantothenate--cysteine ligase